MIVRVGWTLAVLIGGVAALAQSPPGAAIDGTALLRQVDQRLNPPSYEAYKRLVNVEPNGRSREYLLYQVADGREKVAACSCLQRGIRAGGKGSSGSQITSARSVARCRCCR
jgi:hypothetical protein